jgi:hypothetical protein
MLHKIINSPSTIAILSSISVINIVLCYKNNKESVINKYNAELYSQNMKKLTDSNTQLSQEKLIDCNTQQSQSSLVSKENLIIPCKELIVFKENHKKIKALPEINISDRKFNNIFYEKYIDGDNIKYSKLKYHEVFSNLESYGFVDDYSNCELLKDWVDCHNTNHTLIHENITYISGKNKNVCSIQMY